MEKNCCIEMKGIGHRFGTHRVLNDIDVCINHGEIFGILGPSGCGKTTMVKIMAGILQATEGEIQVLGHNMPNLQMMDQLGYMAQSDALYSLLSAQENLQFFGSIYGLKKMQLQQRILAVMDLVNLADRLESQVQDFSGGMKRRLSLAIALLHQPPILILDEPTVGIDPLLRQEVWEELYRLAQQGVSVVVTTHVMDEAEKCNRLAMMRDGRLIAEGSPAELLRVTGTRTLEEVFLYYGGLVDES